MKIVVTAGGGGHFSPALSVIKAMPSDWEVLFVGRKYAFEADKTISFEYTSAARMGIPFRWITTARLQRKFTRHTLSSFLKFPIGLYQSFTLLRDYRPNLVLSFGGYVAVPVVLAAAFLRIPIVVHEQTLGVGLANKITAHFAKYICISWEESRRYFPKEKTILTGNPLKISVMHGKDFFAQHRISSQDEALPLLYITGGSLGSHPINQLIEECIEKLLQKYVVVHQTGDAKHYGDFDRLSAKKAALSSTSQKRYILTKFVEPEELGSLLQKATLVIARSGINTISELLYFGKPALLIPLSFSQGNEQWTNALFFKKQGLGEAFKQDALTSGKLYEHIVSMLAHKDRYEKHAQIAKTMITHTASAQILAVCKKSLYD